MPPVSEVQRRAMYAAKAGKSNIGIPQKVGAEFVAADKPGKLPMRAKKHALGGYVGSKGDGPRDQEDRPRGGPSITERSRFMKTPDTFRTSLQQQDYDKPSAGHKRPSGEGKIEEVEE